MSGLALKVGGFGGVGTTNAPSMGPAASYNTVTAAAFGPGATVAPTSTKDCLMPNDGFGVAFWTGIVAVAALVLIRHSLPG